MCASLLACAHAPPPVPDPDVAAVLWGDEYDGLLLDTDTADADLRAARRSFSADAAFGESARTTRASGALGIAAARYRESAAGQAGALEVSSRRLGLVAGAVRPSLGEGALLFDARDASNVVARGARSTDGLRIAPSSSTWGSALGAGVRCSFDRTRAALALWRSRESADDASAFASVGFGGRRTVAHATYGRSRAGASAVSLCVGRAYEPLFLAGETAMAPDGLRFVVRAVGGENGSWRALLATGASAPAADPSPATGVARWGGALERRDTHGGAGSRLVLSSRTRRTDPGGDRRQRAEWYGSVDLTGARLEVGVRATRETSWRAPDLMEIVSPPGPDEELRVRCELRAGEVLADGVVRGEQSWRVELIASRGSRCGRVIAWTGRGRWRWVDARLSVSAFDLPSGRLAYAGRAALPGAPAFITLARSGIDLSASARLRAGPLAGGLQGVRTAAGEGRVVLQAGLSF